MRVFIIVRGVGQGLTHAGDLADWLWYLAVEREWVESLTIMQRFGVRSYDRFRDET